MRYLFMVTLFWGERRRLEARSHRFPDWRPTWEGPTVGITTLLVLLGHAPSQASLARAIRPPAKGYSVSDPELLQAALEGIRSKLFHVNGVRPFL